MKKITPFLWFDSNAEQAAKFYVSVFKDAKITQVARQGGGKKAPAMSVSFRLAGQDFVALNGGPHYRFTPAVSFFIDCKDQKEVDYFWRKLIAGGEASRCGWLTDKYGMSWQIVPSVLGKLLKHKDRAKAARVMQAMLQMVKLDVAGLERAAESSH
jgi:predicted 3-demethylubiquinone-9 3-methyltransferase (glyoxalase superfamily)